MSISLQIKAVEKRASSLSNVEYLAFPVHSDDSRSGLMRRRDKNGLPADPVHVDAGPGLQVVQVDVAIFSDEEDYVLFGTDLNKPGEKPREVSLHLRAASRPHAQGGAAVYLHGHGEVVLGFWGKEHVHGFLWERLVPRRRSPHFNDVQLKQTFRPHKSQTRGSGKSRDVEPLQVLLFLPPAPARQSRREWTLQCCPPS